ncbi:hypothetical protein PFICI_11858 [Pestalotiopsis fici W106-1]|uniref:Mg2+ transporter protein, CorA-like/Zinc transport protein ZntB n=1 Tax=Pestalotiopsis fici (strain W106-1 / CGMCC3.15140) TaxID=1229662 RepID=W3WUD2_PESFW|nr:uncharacterized protein PFICI_11858 [Pestalotiopsis fici W106-1]ETS76471.1 hypothetical protein PFICI_11858 [Pestalotiopsis fici W106-1]
MEPQETFQVKHISPFTVMEELSDADFTSVPLDEPGFFEAATNEQGEHVSRHGSINWSDFDGFLDLKGSYEFPVMSEAVRNNRPSLRVINVPLGKSWDKMNMTRDDWDRLQSKFELHESTVYTIVDLTGAFATYFYRAADSSRSVERIKIVIKVANKITIGYEALSLAFDLKTLATRVLLHGAMPPQWKDIVRLLYNSLHLCPHPLLLPVLVFASHRRNMERYRTHIDKSILALEQETGFGASGFLVTASNATSGRQDFHIESALVRLQSQQTELATVINISRYSESLASFLIDANIQLSAALGWQDHASVMKAEDGVLHMLVLAQSQAKTSTSVIQSLKERVQSQTNLIFSLISSEENRISRRVAEESAKVAISSKRDSMAMKTVAVLTMIFLPGTFVAAFLSMPLFEWNADTGAYPSSTPFQWVYWAITLPLTILLMAGWRAWWAIEEKSWRLELKQAEAQNRQRLSARPNTGRTSALAPRLSDVSDISMESRLVRWQDLRLRNLIARGR